jgi:outer membrane protein assembly factor BamB
MRDSGSGIKDSGFKAALVLVISVGIGSTLTSQAPPSTDWPQWRGPDRSGVSRETGLLKEWPKSGPPQIWSVSDLGSGYGSISTSGDRIFVQGMKNRQSVITALNRADGKTVWTKVIGQAQSNDRGPGPRGTPTVDGDRVYVLTENGDLSALRTQDGTRLWQRNILAEFRANNIGWLISESPLVDGNLVIVTPGGRGAGMAALDKMTGKTVWTSKDLHDEAGYSSPVVADVQGVRTVMTLTSQAGVGVRVSDGKLMWRYQEVANNTANAATPVYSDNKVFYSSGYNTGGALLALRASGGQVQAREVYFTREMQNHHGGVVLVGSHLYGFNNAILACLDFATGKTIWRDRSVGKGAITAADGHLYVLGEDHVMGLVEASPAGYREKGRFSIRDQGLPSWAHPVVSGGHLYIRNQATLTSYDIRGKTKNP